MKMRTRAVLTACIAVPALVAGTAAVASSAPRPAPRQPAITQPATTQPMTTQPTVAPDAPHTDWPAYHGDVKHSGYAAGLPAAGALSHRWTAKLDGVVQASPLVIGTTVIAATENNTVYALERATGHVLWKKHLAPPVPIATLPCGNVTPVVGITGTPVYDPATRRVFAVTTTPVGSSSLKHTLVGLDLESGTLEVQGPADPQGADPLVENQRGALGLSPQTGRVLVTYGGNSGDCGDYHGYLVSFKTTTAADSTVFRTGTGTEAGQWQPSGAAVDDAGMAYVVSGNGSVTAPPYDGSDSVNRVDPATGRRLSFFAPSGWAHENAVDADLGSSGVALVNGLAWIQGKTDTGYLLHKDALGGIGHPAAVVTGACRQQFGGPAVHDSVVIAACSDGIRKITVNQDATYALGWKAPDNVSGAPVIGGGRVWSLDPDGGRLYSLDESSGATKGSISVGTTVRFATPALSGALVLVPTMTGISAIAGA